ncbi:MAG: hypothetical protein WD382_00625 [Halofilum sp. (in: g-proteobacteria)]
MTVRAPWAVLLVPALLPLAGCYEELTPAYYEPGEYKGEQDPLLDKLEHREMQDELEQRFDRTARDR